MLDISPILLISSALVFLLVLARLNSCLYKPLFKHMEERDSKIESDMIDAKNNGANVDGMLEEANHIISEGKKEAISIRERARSEAESVAASKLSKAKVKTEEKYNDFVKTLVIEKESLENSMNLQMPVFKKNLQAKLSTI